MQTALRTSSLSLAAPSAVASRPGTTAEPSPPQLGTTRRIAKGDGIFAEGDPATTFYKVMSGAVRTSQLLSDGRRQIDAFHLPGDIFGIESGQRHLLAADAIDDTTLIAYRRRQTEAGNLHEGELGREIMAAMVQALERARAHMMLLGRKNALERIATFLLDLSARLPDIHHIDLPMSRMDIADHLGITIETVSRSLTQLEREGVIELPAHRRSIILRNRAALRRLDG